MSWKKVSLGEICDNLDGKRKPLNDIQKSKIRGTGKYPYFGANNIMDWVDEYIFDEKILCIAEDGGSWGLNQKCSFIYNDKCWVNNHAHVLRARKSSNLEYLMYYLNHTNLNNYITGSTRGKLTKSALESIQIPLPDLPTQQHIAAVLDKADALRQQNQQLLAHYDELLQGTFIALFGDPVTNEKGWEVKKLGEAAKVGRGRFSPRPRNDPSYYDGIHPFIQTGDISSSNHRLSKWSQTLNEKGTKVSKRFDRGTIVVAIVGATIGASAILQINSYAPDSVVGIEVNEKYVSNYYLEFVLRYWKPIFLERAPATARADINLETFRPLPIPIPPLSLQNHFAEIVEKIEVQKEQAQVALAESEALFEGLLAGYFGENQNHPKGSNPCPPTAQLQLF